jgi:hypothetical protein
MDLRPDWRAIQFKPAAGPTDPEYLKLRAVQTGYLQVIPPRSSRKNALIVKDQNRSTAASLGQQGFMHFGPVKTGTRTV